MVDERPADAPDLPAPLEDDTGLRAELGANAPSRTIALAAFPNAHLYQLTACAVATGLARGILVHSSRWHGMIWEKASRRRVLCLVPQARGVRSSQELVSEEAMRP